MSAGPRRARLRSGGTAVLAQTLRPVLDVAGVASGVTEVLDAVVRERGDDALVEGARRFDCPDFTHDRLRVPSATLARAAASMDEGLRTAIGVAAAQVRLVAEATLPQDREVRLPAGQAVTVRSIPVDAAGCYVPGGRAAYPSRPDHGRRAGPGGRGAADRRGEPPGAPTAARPSPSSPPRRSSGSTRSTRRAARRRSERSPSAPPRSRRWP